MKSVRIHRYGGPEVLTHEDVDIPSPGRDDVLIRVAASGVNPVDWKFREGELTDLVPRQLPVTIGWEASGTVEACGPDIVDLSEGMEVMTRPDPSAGGTYAEYLVVSADEVARKPSNLSHIEAAALPLAGLAAHALLIGQGELRAGERVLILGGAGGVGHLAIQIAKAKGAWVAATTSASNLEFVRSLGADLVLDYASSSLSLHVEAIDLVADTIGPQALAPAWATISQGGRVRSIVVPPKAPGGKTIDAAFVYAPPDRQALEDLLRLVEAGDLRPVIEETFALEDAVFAQDRSQNGHVRGKLVLTL